LAVLLRTLELLREYLVENGCFTLSHLAHRHVIEIKFDIKFAG
jgi:hypothetical protein